MVVKKEMVREIGQEEILLPELLEKALLANDRIKYYLTLLQTAQQKAEYPNEKFSQLREERESVSEEAERLDNVISGSTKTSEGDYDIPFADDILESIKLCLEQMLRPLDSLNDRTGSELHERTRLLIEKLPNHVEMVPLSLIETITSGERGGLDSVHLLVMDLHKALNAMQAIIAEEDILGAKSVLVRER